MEQNDISSRIVFADRGKVNVEKGVEFAPKFDQKWPDPGPRHGSYYP